MTKLILQLITLALRRASASWL